MKGTHKTTWSGLKPPPLPTAKDLVIRAYVETERQGEPAFLGRFKLLMRSNPQCQDPVYEHYALAILRAFLRTKSAYRNNNGRRKKMVEGMAAELYKTAYLMLPMPNDKLMRDCTGAEMSSFGKGYARIAEAVGPDRKVGDVLDEEAVRALMKMPK